MYSNIFSKLAKQLYSGLKSGIYIRNSYNNTFIGNSIYDNGNYGLLLGNNNFTDIIGNSVLNNNVTGLYFNNSLHNNITANTINYHNYPIFLHSSNYTLVINNTGFGNNNDIIEKNCDNTNYFKDNDFSNFIGPRGGKDGISKTSADKIIIDFTVIIIIVCLVSFIMFLHNDFMKKKINFFKKK